MRQANLSELPYYLDYFMNTMITHTNRFCHPSTKGDNTVAVVPANTLRSFINLPNYST